MTGQRDTIFALSSGGLPSGVAVMRVSGPASLEIASRMASPLPSPRLSGLRTIRNRNGDVLDQSLVLSFRGPRSFTGEDCVEFHLHGSRAVVAAVSEALVDFGCRLAEAGEFSRRAFENGKLDLAEIEGLSDLLVAETEMQRRLAVSEGFGVQSSIYASWRGRLLHGRAMLEAELDFADEDDIPGSVSDTVRSDLISLVKEMETHLQAQRSGELVREGFNVVIAGAPNSGKSSLINVLAGSEVAIVTDVAGTTRDVLKVDLDINGHLIRVFDTAGLRITEDLVEQIGIERAEAKIRGADLVLELIDVSAPSRGNLPATGADIWCIGTKADLLDGPAVGFDLVLSCKTGEGIRDLHSKLGELVQHRVSAVMQTVPSRRRHAGHIGRAILSLKSALDSDIGHVELLAENLRRATDELARIFGRVDTEEVLGVIFSSFCIGK